MQQIVMDQPFVVTITRVPRILIVDDEDSVAYVFRRALKRLADYEVVAVTDSREALEVFNEQHFDLVITDYQMPKMNGITLSKKIRQLSSHIPIIMITAFADEALHYQAAAHAIHSVLRKPIDIVELYHVVSNVLQETALY